MDELMLKFLVAVILGVCVLLGGMSIHSLVKTIVTWIHAPTPTRAVIRVGTETQVFRTSTFFALPHLHKVVYVSMAPFSVQVHLDSGKVEVTVNFIVKNTDSALLTAARVLAPAPDGSIEHCRHLLFPLLLSAANKALLDHPGLELATTIPAVMESVLTEMGLAILSVAVEPPPKNWM